jgi:hypothetical protein
MPQRISSFDHYIERSGDLKFEYLNEEENAGNFNSLQRFATLTRKDGGNLPLGEWETEESRRGAVEVKNKR